ncbi:hypothetical protein V1520DRAFT_376679 [Lipomyces starkeyi]|uniref:Uncharacterized protein n=1 Tax=Lipomyces starkeyi NRRL Y-11557 TaxID=675824 RepID=A0A1E3QEE3_LIPST|nr:hypothetical protein LIPSTDRAFT_89161 [Lipomyces starkeyi NRRL Y-11557]
MYVQTFSSSSCVDSAGFSACYAKATDSASACINAAGSDMAVIACGCAEYVSLISCVATSCWNQVYSCEYQKLVIEYLEYCPVAGLPVPFFPPPNNAAEACSCNLGKVYVAVNNSISEVTQCETRLITNPLSSNIGNGVQEDIACICCGESAAISSIYSICPNTDPGLLDVNNILALFSSFDQPFSTCGQYLSSYNCGSDLGFSQVDGGTFYGPNNLPPIGTKTLSNGGGSITSPVGGATFTWTQPNNSPYTIVAAPYSTEDGRIVCCSWDYCI